MHACIEGISQESQGPNSTKGQEVLKLIGGPKNESLHDDLRELSETGWFQPVEVSLALSFQCVKKRIESAMLVYAMVLLHHVISRTSATTGLYKRMDIYLLAAAMGFRMLPSLTMST